LINKLQVFVFSVFLCAVSITNSTAQDAVKDSVQTSFRKGRWLSGFSGSISSSSTKNTSTDNKTVSNRFRVEVSSGKFILDRLSLGFNLDLERDNIQGDEEVRTSEDLFIAPKGTYYFSKSKIGSLFLSFSPGFILYRDETNLSNDINVPENINKGSGFGSKTTIGYSYVIFDLVTFDLGLNWSAFRINITQSSSQVENTNNTKLILSDLSFSFGFKIFLGI